MKACGHLGRGSYCITCVEALDLQISELQEKAAAAALLRVKVDLQKDELEAANRLNGELRNASEIGAKWMRWWLEQQECDCEEGHICGRQDRLLELEKMEAVLTPEVKRICKWIRKDELGSCPSCGQLHPNYTEKLVEPAPKKDPPRGMSFPGSYML